MKIKNKTKPLTYILIILFLNSCNYYESQKLDYLLRSKNFIRDLKYEPISLIYKGEPLLSPGQKVEVLDASYSFRGDPEGVLTDEWNLIGCTLSMDSYLSIELEKGSINGIFHFYYDKKENQIFDAFGSWTFDTELTENNKAGIIEQFTEKLFPVLKNKLKLETDWKHENEKENYIEYFSFNSPNENSRFWNLDYKIKMK